MSDKAKPCWYCGEDEQLSVVPQCTSQELADSPMLVQTFAVQCAACAAQGPQWTDAETAINLWNSRPMEDALQKRIDELLKALAERPPEDCHPVFVSGAEAQKHVEQLQARIAELEEKLDQWSADARENSDLGEPG